MRITVLAALVIAAPLLSYARSGDHGAGHAEHHDWYRQLLHPNTGVSCCGDRDCRPTRAYVDDNGAWRAQLNGAWVKVPRAAVLSTRAPDGNSHICATDAGVILCFIGGVPKA
ncbi:MAG: hypothetical protein KF889_23900 [Alphaproteobacteria bacterium]|nr:hypothetical protein [Alphaproteobacteria bacterium]MCW5742787.1 hypothetical protein [Alphaproteobacteria bacterium]